MKTALARIWAHLVCGRGAVRRLFPDPVLERVEQAVAQGELRHGAEVRIAIEACLPWQRAARGVTPRERALEVFSELRVWDTAANNGILLYLLLADHAIEIVADRAAAASLGQPALQQVCDSLRDAIRAGRAEQGLLEALASLHERLAAAFPIAAKVDNIDELPNRPAIL